MKIEVYVLTLLAVSFVFFYLVGSWLTTSIPYTDFLLTIAVVHFVMSKLFEIKKKLL